jgi:hypothetical protein
MADPTPPDATDPRTLVGLDVDAARFAEVAAAFAEIRGAIEALRRLDLGDSHPAVVFAPIGAADGD